MRVALYRGSRDGTTLLSRLRMGREMLLKANALGVRTEMMEYMRVLMMIRFRTEVVLATGPTPLVTAFMVDRFRAQLTPKRS